MLTGEIGLYNDKRSAVVVSSKHAGFRTLSLGYTVAASGVVGEATRAVLSDRSSEGD